MIYKIIWFDLKIQSNEIFDHQFFPSFEPAWATDQRIEIVSFRYTKFDIQNTDFALYVYQLPAVCYAVRWCCPTFFMLPFVFHM